MSAAVAESPSSPQSAMSPAATSTATSGAVGAADADDVRATGCGDGVADGAGDPDSRGDAQAATTRIAIRGNRRTMVT
jgi:hypothetical protein